MFLRFITGASIFALGFYFGREVGRMERLFGELERTYDARVPHAGTYDHEGPANAHIHTSETSQKVEV